MRLVFCPLAQANLKQSQAGCEIFSRDGKGSLISLLYDEVMSTISKALVVLAFVSLGRAQAQVESPPQAFEGDSTEMVVPGQQDSLTRDTLSWQDACWGQALVEATRAAADSYREKPGERLCYRYVKQGVSQALGISLSGGSAYLAANQLAGSDHFREASVKASDLPGLPAGSIVVWGKSKKRPHGHISVADGQGKEISDRVRPQITGYGTQLRVFLPVCQVWSGGAP